MKDRITAAREHANLTRTELAKAVGVKSYETIRQWEEGKIQPRPSRYRRIARATGVNEAWIASGEGRMLGGRESSASATEVARLARMLTLQERLALAAEILASAQKDAAK